MTKHDTGFSEAEVSKCLSVGIWHKMMRLYKKVTDKPHRSQAPALPTNHVMSNISKTQHNFPVPISSSVASSMNTKTKEIRQQKHFKIREMLPVFIEVAKETTGHNPDTPMT